MSKPWPPPGYQRKATPEAIEELEQMVSDLIRIGSLCADRSELYRRRAFAMLEALRKERANRRAWTQIAERFAAELNRRSE